MREGKTRSPSWNRGGGSTTAIKELAQKTSQNMQFGVSYSANSSLHVETGHLPANEVMVGKVSDAVAGQTGLPGANLPVSNSFWPSEPFPTCVVDKSDGRRLVSYRAILNATSLDKARCTPNRL